MESIREGGSTNRPPVLDGTNYAYWKARMIAFLKSIDSKTWKSVIIGWTHPVTVNDEGIESLKPEKDWTDAEDEAALRNSRALNALFNGVDQNIFKLINTCVSAAEAWRILEVAYEGTSKVKISRLQILTSQFENLKMSDDETIAEFNVKVLDIANESFSLGEKISDAKLVRKVLRSLPSKFNMKVAAIEKENDISKMKLDELFGSLRMFELSLNENFDEKNKGVALHSSNLEKMPSNKDKDNDENLTESLVLLTKQFSKIVKRFNKRPGNYGSSSGRDNYNYSYNNNNRPSYQSRGRRESKRNNDNHLYRNDRDFKCRECGGNGHYQVECPNYLRRNKKGFKVQDLKYEFGT